ncbi:MAG: nuclear transport factor 2 family protein [Tatlockia sp.]|nr:nuclear transport factor 2 family protein [Tatlockia sp.]
MFDKVTVEKNDRAIPLYYDKDFEMYSNGIKMDFDEFLKMHRDIYKTSIQYKIRYDEKTFIEQGNKVAMRLFITTKNPNDMAREIEVILIGQYKNSKLYRVWELTYPDWSKIKAFSNKSK